MKLQITSLVLITGLFFSSCSKDSKVFTEEDVAKMGNSSIEGTVLSRHGVPLPGALVVLRPTGQTTVSGTDGSYTLSNLPAGRYAVEYLLTDYKDTLQMDSVVLGMKDLKTNNPMQLRYRYAQIKGTVVDASATPAQGAGIIVEEQDLETQAASNGKFSIRKIEPGRIRLFSVVQGVGYGYQEIDVQSDTIYENVQIALNQRGGAVQGKVIDANGNVVSGATVSSFDGALSATTNASGEYSLTEIPKDGNMQLVVSKGGQQGIGNGINLRGKPDMSIMPIRINPIALRDLSIIPTTIFGGDSHDPTTLLMHPVAADSSIKPLWFYWSFDNGTTWQTTYTRNILITPASFKLGKGTHEFKVWCMTQDSIASDTATSYLVVTSGSADTTSSTVNVDSLLSLDSLSIWHTGMVAGYNALGSINELQIYRVNSRNLFTSRSIQYASFGTIGGLYRMDSATALAGTDINWMTTGWPDVCGTTWGFINANFVLSMPTDSGLLIQKNPADTTYTVAQRTSGQAAFDASRFEGISITYIANAPIGVRMAQKSQTTWNTYGWFNLPASSTPRTLQLSFANVIQGYSDTSTFTFDPSQLLDIQVMQRQEEACNYTDSTTMQILDLSLVKTVHTTTSSSSTNTSSSSAIILDTSTWSGNMKGNIWTATQITTVGTPLIQTQTGGNISFNWPDSINSSISPSTPQGLGMNTSATGYYADSIYFSKSITSIPGTIFWLKSDYTSIDVNAHTGACITYLTSDTTWDLHFQSQAQSTAQNWNNYRTTLPATNNKWITYKFKWNNLWQDPFTNGNYTTFTFDPTDQINIQLMSRATAPFPANRYIAVKQIGFDNSCD